MYFLLFYFRSYCWYKQVTKDLYFILTIAVITVATVTEIINQTGEPTQHPKDLCIINASSKGADVASLSNLD